MMALFAGIEKPDPAFVFGLLACWCCVLFGPPLLLCLVLWGWSRRQSPDDPNPPPQKPV
jgi:hypothetical protein